MAVGIRKIACVTAPKGLLRSLDDRGAGLLRLSHNGIYLGLASHVMAQGEFSGTSWRDGQAGVVREALARPEGQLESGLKVNEDHGPVLPFGTDDSRRRQAK